jgi:lysine 6-dehydrogenase
LKEPLSEPELLEFPGVGTLEAFNTDGLRSLAYTLKAPFMKEKTLRWPGHSELMRVLRDTGFFSLDVLDVGGQKVRPRDVTAALLFPKWTFEEGEPDLTVMRVRVEGHENGERVVHAWDFVDRFHEGTGLRSMSRSTGRRPGNPRRRAGRPRGARRPLPLERQPARRVSPTVANATSDPARLVRTKEVP